MLIIVGIKEKKSKNSLNSYLPKTIIQSLGKNVKKYFIFNLKNKIILEKKKEKFIKINNLCKIAYKIKEENYLKVIGKVFTKNNKRKCNLIINNKKHDLKNKIEYIKKKEIKI